MKTENRPGEGKNRNFRMVWDPDRAICGQSGDCKHLREVAY